MSAATEEVSGNHYGDLTSVQYVSYCFLHGVSLLCWDLLIGKGEF